MKIEKTLICMLADAPEMVLGATFDLCCATCARKVMVAPSGQRLLRENPETRVICVYCFLTLGGEYTVALAATKEELRAELKAFAPNYRRNRN